MSIHHTIIKKYVSRKVKAVRWKPSVSNFEHPNKFVTGSWDDEDNVISIWQLRDTDIDPVLLQTIHQPSSVNDIQYVLRDTFAVGLGNGSISLFEHSQSGIVCKHSWNNCHHLPKGPVPVTSLSSNGESIASVGDDGRLIIINPQQNTPLHSTESSGGCSECAVVFVRASQLLTANMQGHMKVWDLREDCSSPVDALLSPDQVSIYDLAIHPTQQHLIAAAGEDGTLALWDMRSTSQPLALIAAHEGPMNEIQFHPASSNHLFSCGSDGQLIHWDASKSSSGVSKTVKEDLRSSQTNAWFSNDVARGSIESTSLIANSPLPINSLCVDGTTLLSGSDNEAVYVIKDVLYL